MTVTRTASGARPRWWTAGLAWALWTLGMLGVVAIWRLDHLLRQAGRSDLAPLGAGVAAPFLAALSSATVGAVLAIIAARACPVHLRPPGAGPQQVTFAL